MLVKGATGLKEYLCYHHYQHDIAFKMWNKSIPKHSYFHTERYNLSNREKHSPYNNRMTHTRKDILIRLRFQRHSYCIVCCRLCEWYMYIRYYMLVDSWVHMSGKLISMAWEFEGICSREQLICHITLHRKNDAHIQATYDFSWKYWANIAWTYTVYVGFRSKIINAQHVSRIIHRVRALLWLLLHAEQFYSRPLWSLPFQRRNKGIMGSQITDNSTF